MANVTKITLSEQELVVVTDRHWILTKQAITAKIYELFNEQVPVIRKQMDLLPEALPAGLAFSLPKISRGENYNGFPYVMLDYPAVFKKDDIFALRTMLWWGNFISITVLLSGGYKELYSKVVLQHCLHSPGELYICVHDDPWEHHLEKSNYMQIRELDPCAVEKIVSEKNFLKLALKMEMKSFNDPKVFETAYAKICELFV